MTDVEWIRPAPRPDYGRDDVEWWYVVADGLRLPEGDEVGRRCSVVHCAEICWLVRSEMIRSYGAGASRRPYMRRSFRCRNHVYGHPVVENGRVLVSRPRWFDES